MHAGNVQLQNSSRLEFSDILAAIGLADAILNAVDFALGGKPRVDRDCDPDPWTGGQLSGSFQVSVDVIQIPGGDLEQSGSFQVSMDVVQIPGGQLSGSFQVSMETIQCISRLSTCCLAHPSPMLSTRLTCVRSTLTAFCYY